MRSPLHLSLFVAAACTATPPTPKPPPTPSPAVAARSVPQAGDGVDRAPGGASAGTSEPGGGAGAGAAVAEIGAEDAAKAGQVIDRKPVAPSEPAAVVAPEAVALAGAGAAAQETSAAPGDAGASARATTARRRRARARVEAWQEPTAFDQELRARDAFAVLQPRERQELADWIASEAPNLPTFQNSLVRHVLEAAATDPGAWKELPETPFFDPETHAPVQPIPRRRLAADDPVAVAVRRQVLGAMPARRVRSAWVYDYGSRELYRLPGEADPTRVFENALAGAPPGWDYVEALVERTLDDGSQQKLLEAFGHAYTDRDGNVYPGITLYEAWASRSAIEMPDVDNLGIVHVLVGDWDTWKPPVSDDLQPSLYAKVGELFRTAQNHRGLRHALARCYLFGSTELRDSYTGGHLENFHALWEEVSSTPATLAERLPAVDAWREFLQDLGERMAADETAFLKGIRRHLYLDQDSAQVRALALRLVQEYGAYERLDAEAEAKAGER